MSECCGSITVWCGSGSDAHQSLSVQNYVSIRQTYPVITCISYNILESKRCIRMWWIRIPIDITTKYSIQAKYRNKTIAVPQAYLPWWSFSMRIRYWSIIVIYDLLYYLLFSLYYLILVICYSLFVICFLLIVICGNDKYGIFVFLLLNDTTQRTIPRFY